MKRYFLSLCLGTLLFHTIALAQSEDFATITIKANNKPVSIKINGDQYESVAPNKTLSFGISMGEKKHIVLEDTDGNKYVKDITASKNDQGKTFIVQFPAASAASLSTSVKEHRAPERTLVTSKTGATTGGNNVEDVALMEKELNDRKINTGKSATLLQEMIDKIREGKLSRNDKDVTAAYSTVKEALDAYRKVQQDYKARNKMHSSFLKAQGDTMAIRKILSNYEAIRDGKKPSSKNLIIAFNKNRAYDLHFWITKKNVTDTLIDEKPTLFYALQQKCDASVINYLIQTAGGKEDYINYDKYSFLPPNQRIYMMPLTLACINGDTSIVSLLLDAKARFYPRELDEYKAKEQRKFLWQQFGANKEIRSIISTRALDFPDPFVNVDIAVKGILNSMVLVDAGKFKMGCQGDRVDCGRAWPQVELMVSPFAISKFEVTQQQWQALMDYNPASTANCPDCPVERVTWDEVQLFIKKLNGLTGKNFRLPTEKEWEFAAKGGVRSSLYKYSGSNYLDSVSWNKTNTATTQPVGKKQPNELGLYDMSGNVFEWCNSYFTESLEIYKTSADGATHGTERITRGGSFRMEEFFSQPIRRSKAPSNMLTDDIGFRLALDQ